jgi:hypothetical protein
MTAGHRQVTALDVAMSGASFKRVCMSGAGNEPASLPVIVLCLAARDRFICAADATPGGAERATRIRQTVRLFHNGPYHEIDRHGAPTDSVIAS